MAKRQGELADEILLDLPDVYHDNPDMMDEDAVSFFSLSPEEQEAILREWKIFDRAIKELVQHIPATLDGTCPIDTGCPESWLKFFRYLHEKTKNPFWKELYDTTDAWYTREYREGWTNAVGFPAEAVFYAEDTAVALGGAVSDKWTSVSEDYLNTHAVEKIVFAVASAFWMYAMMSFIDPRRGLDLAGPVATVGIGMIASEVVDMNIIRDRDNIVDVAFFYRSMSLLMHLLIYYRAYTWLPEFDGRNYIIATPVISEMSRQWLIYKMRENTKFYETIIWRLTRSLNIFWGAYMIYLSRQIVPALQVHIRLIQQRTHI